MINIYSAGHVYGLEFLPESYETFNNLDEIKLASGARLAFISNADIWYSLPREFFDVVVFWTTESLSWERTQNKPIVPLSDKDIIFSSSQGPNNDIDLLYWYDYVSGIYKSKFKKFLPSLEISNHKLFCSLGKARLPRTYAYCKFHELDLIKPNHISFVSRKIYKNIESPDNMDFEGQSKMADFVANSSIDLQEPIKINFKDDWNISKRQNDWYTKLRNTNVNVSAIFPTKVINQSSLLFAFETEMHNLEHFSTEKTVKALISGRPSIIIASQGYLDYVKKLGFKTWDGIIDEKYQYYSCHKTRIDKAINEAQRFLSTDVLGNKSLQEQIKDIAIYNRNHLFQTDWKYNQKIAWAKILKKLNNK